MTSPDQAPNKGGSDEFGEDECTLWGETMINDVIQEANQQQCDPESYIKARKAGGDDVTPKTEFRTIYKKQQPISLVQKLLAKLPWRK